MLIYTTCLSLISPVGLCPASAAAAMRAGIAAFSELHCTDQDGHAVIGAPVPAMDQRWRGRDRLAELLARAFATIETPADLPPALALQDLPILLCTREPQRPGPRLDGLVDEVQQRLSIPLRRKDSGHFGQGGVAVFEALAHARTLLAQGAVPGCLVVAVDTLLDARTLAWLEETKRLKTPERSDGIIPGEAAGVVLVTAVPTTPLPVAVHGLGFAKEVATVLNDEPFLGKGMASAVRAALGEARLALHDIDFRLSDVAGESYAFEELALAQSRLTRQTRPIQALWHPAASMGDCGAASGLVQLAWAEQAFARQYAPGPLAMAHASVPTGARAAAALGH